MKKRTRGLALLLGILLMVSSVVSSGSMAVLADEPFVSRLTGTDNAMIYGAEDMLGDGSRLLKVSSETNGNDATFTATEEATTYGNHLSYVRAYTTLFTPTAGTTVMEFDTVSYRAGSKGMYYYIYYGADWDTKTTIKSGSVLGMSAGHVTVQMTTTVKNDGSKVATFQVNNGDPSAEIAVGETGRFFLYFDKFYHVPATEMTEAEFSTINISNFHMYHAASTTFAGQRQANGNIAFNQPVASYTATIDGSAATLTKAAETKTSINEYIVDDTTLAVGTHTLQIEATSRSGQTATVTCEIVKEPALVSRLTGTDGTLYGTEKMIGSVSNSGNRVTSNISESSLFLSATETATSTSANTNYSRILLEPFGASEGITVLEFDTEAFRADGKAEYFYIYYGNKWSGGTRTKIYSGGTLNTSKVHWTLIMTNSSQEDGSTKVNFQLYKNGDAVTLDANDLAGLSDGKIIFYFDKFYYLAATAEAEASASTVTVSDFNVYRPSSSSFKGQVTESGNVVFNLPVTSCSVTIDGDAASMTKAEETETAINEYKVDAGYLGSGKHTVVVTATAVDGQTTTVTYEIEGVYPAFEAKVMNASGGADAIVSMTFDDGLYDTALFLNEKFAQYGLKGSTMLITSRIENDDYAGTLEEWKALYQQGYLEPESHSYSHYMLPTEDAAESNAKNDDGTINETKKAQLLAHNTPENYQRELVDSYADILRLFDHASVGFAPAYNTLSDGAYEVVMDTYYGVRSGSRGVQSLDPQIGKDRGQWHNLLMRSFSDAKNNAETLCEQIDTAVEEKGWYISLCHGVGDGDITEENAEIVFKHISDLVKAGKVWCTTFGEAIKYVRERQASTLQANSDGETITLNLTCAMETEDGLALPADIFDVPLTVKVLLPEGWTGVNMTQNGETTTVDAVINAGVSYAYLDIVPNSGAVTLTTAEIIEQPLGEPYLTLEGKPTEKFFAGEYQIHVPVPQRADTTSFAVLGAQYKDGRLVGIKTQTFDVEKIDGDTEMVLDVTITGEAEQLVCMVWDGMTTMKPITTKTFEKILPEEDAPYVILKFDDLGTSTMAEFQTAVTLCEEQGVVASLGLIGERFTEETDASVYTTIRNWHDNGFEIWHHGFDHAQAEYSTCTVEQQKEFFGKTLDLVQEKCGITITAFGSPYNNSTTTTRDMIEEHFPQIKAIMLADYAGTDTITVLDSRVNLETQTGVIASYQTFQNRYAKRGDKDYIVLQGHPSAWSEDSLLNLKLNIQFLKEKGCIFITPTAYVNK